MLEKVMSQLISHAKDQVEYAGSPKSAFLDNASEDSLNIDLAVKAFRNDGLITPSIQDSDDIYRALGDLRSVDPKNEKQFKSCKVDVLVLFDQLKDDVDKELKSYTDKRISASLDAIVDCADRYKRNEDQFREN